jgi:hypothetical protein
MALVPIFHGRVTPDARLELRETERTQRRLHLQSLAGRDVEIVIRKERKQRSLKQNAYWHSQVFPLLAEELGYDSIDALKFDLMGECWGWTETNGGHRIPVKMRTSELTTEEGAKFTDWLVRFGATLPSPVRIPLPGEAEAA